MPKHNKNNNKDHTKRLQDKLRAKNVRHLQPDEDMDDKINTAKDSFSSLWRLKRESNRLLPNTFGWYKVTINGGQRYETDIVVDALLNAMSPHVFIPQYWSSNRYCVTFFIDDLKVARNIQKFGRGAQLASGYRLKPLVNSGTPVVTIDDTLKKCMTNVMAKRYNCQTKSLDLSRFHADAELKPIFCPLYQVTVMRTALDIICENIPDVEAINLSENNLALMAAFRGVDKRLPHLKILNLGDNKLYSLFCLRVFRNLPIVELDLRNNPCWDCCKNALHFVQTVRSKFTQLTKLNDETLAPASTWATPKATFLCDPSGVEIVRKFLDEYFNIFDTCNRQLLLNAYHEETFLSITTPSSGQAGRLEHFWRFNRNLLLNGNADRSLKLCFGRLNCVSTLNEWPRTIHERRTFTVDLTLFNPLMIVFTITGLFKELTGKANETKAANLQNYELRYFMRNFVIVPHNNAFCIRNEIIFVTSATPEQLRGLRHVQEQPNTGGTSEDANLTKLNSSTAAAMPDEHTKLQMVQAMSAQTQMNLVWSRKCLEETNWDYNNATYAFDKFFKENKIPQEAFAKTELPHN